MRSALALLVAGTACGRIGFGTAGDGIGGDVGSDGGPADGPALELACSETRSVGGPTIAGIAFEVVLSARGLAALWLDPAGALRGITWSADAAGGVVAGAPVKIAAGPFAQLAVAANGDEILVLTQTAAGAIAAHFVAGDLAPLGPSTPLAMSPLRGRAPVTRRRGGTGFLAIGVGAQPIVYEIDRGKPLVPHPLQQLAGHDAASITSDQANYAVVTERANQFGTGCWYSAVDDALALAGAPVVLESPEQDDCDTSIAMPSSWIFGAAITWIDRDQKGARVNLHFTDLPHTISSGGSGEANLALPISTDAVDDAHNAGIVTIYRSSAGLRAFVHNGLVTLAPSFGFADLVSWADRAIAVWTTSAGEPQLTRLCPPVEAFAPL